MKRKLFFNALIAIPLALSSLLYCSSPSSFCRSDGDCKNSPFGNFCCLGRCVDSIEKCKKIVLSESKPSERQKPNPTENSKLPEKVSERTEVPEYSDAYPPGDGKFPEGVDVPPMESSVEGVIPDGAPPTDWPSGEGVIPDGTPPMEPPGPDGGGGEGGPVDSTPISYCKIPCCVTSKGRNICKEKPKGQKFQLVVNFDVEYSLMTYYGCKVKGNCPSASSKCDESLSFDDVLILGTAGGALFVLDKTERKVSGSKRMAVYKLAATSKGYVRKSLYTYLKVLSNTKRKISTYNFDNFIFILEKRYSLNKFSELVLSVLDTRCPPSPTGFLSSFSVSAVMSSNEAGKLFDTSKDIGVTVLEIRGIKYILLYGIQKGAPVFYWGLLSNLVNFGAKNCSRKVYNQFSWNKVPFVFPNNRKNSYISKVISADVSSKYAVIAGIKAKSSNEKIIELYKVAGNSPSPKIEFSFLDEIKSNTFSSLMKSSNLLAVRRSNALVSKGAKVPIENIFYLITSTNIYLFSFDASNRNEYSLFQTPGGMSSYSDFNSLLNCSQDLYVKIANHSNTLDLSSVSYDRLFFVTYSPRGSKQTIRVLLIRSIVSSSP